ncbi:polyphosphate kinase 2 family protein [Microbulbifer thermotolerans]|uniref:polyphosphate kinase 2 family protein n=1 Tax=Microbulbifer thermotolerans TaxID=252514 RepID=UPI0022496D72|nr:polyphosphate kinase 2 family protein [Microbulbifer thermotolerans]MCX2778130.1 polyphosphate kinase 2 family protein [Microbulbifer thermotolerans]MCX2806200.1 polyphosphate kinase 2 family protein [Microbulbifer thermotolerans]MCX2832234.1 polyphosphate kinase 2 family protein [Microbulbifer thermotolerans]
MNYYEKFRVKPGSKVHLDNIDASFKGEHENHRSALPEIQDYNRKIRDLQYLMYAEHKHSLLICLQGRDAAGKDGTINHVLSAMNPQGCTVTGFKQPTAEELDHDFLWRCHKAVPRRGNVAIFNRSHYEDVLVQRVHQMVPKEVWSKRYDHINNFEKLLTDNNTLILKFYLHIDAKEQLARFKKRIDDPTRHWKISESDYTEACYWDAYTGAFQDALEKCSTDYAPWFVIPSNHKWFRNQAISHIVAKAMESLDMAFPKPTENIDEIKKKYHSLDQREQKKGLISGEKKSPKKKK